MFTKIFVAVVVAVLVGLAGLPAGAAQLSLAPPSGESVIEKADLGPAGAKFFGILNVKEGQGFKGMLHGAEAGGWIGLKEEEVNRAVAGGVDIKQSEGWRLQGDGVAFKVGGQEYLVDGSGSIFKMVYEKTTVDGKEGFVVTQVERLDGKQWVENKRAATTERTVYMGNIKKPTGILSQTKEGEQWVTKQKGGSSGRPR